jgi:UDP-N-acetylglucosamine--N-acetylmuramyl-(pentapeptide) pyrophosphoryl-undecaprenol N-acetylglucosamine transferase
MRSILIMAGGTGGHIFPALAVADHLRAQGWRVTWLGSRSGMEATIVPKRGYDARWIRFGAVRGKGILRALLLPLNLLLAFWQSAVVILKVRPDMVLGMGGYITFPGGMMAALLQRPLVLHEQNAVAGLANRILAGVADRILVAFPGTLKRATWTGNPVRAEITQVPAPSARFQSRSGPLHVLVVGGSLGAQALNQVLPEALRLMPIAERPQVTHQAGAKHLEALTRAYADAGVAAATASFIDDMAQAFADADLVICRAGAMTIAELSAVGIASILVPFPQAVDDHQTVNAKFLADQGAAMLLPQAELAPRRLADLLLGFTRATLLDMARKARALGKPDATQLVAEHCMAAVA